MRKERGFSLLETIAAMLLLAIAFGAVMRVSGTAIHATSRVQAADHATMWAEGKLESLGRDQALLVSDSTGRFDETFGWHLRVTEEPGTHPELRLFRLDLDVEWKEGVIPAHLRFTTMRTVVSIPPVAAGGHAG